MLPPLRRAKVDAGRDIGLRIAGRLPALLRADPATSSSSTAIPAPASRALLHEKTFASVNAVVRRLEPPPEFVLFLGDEIAGLTADPAELKVQWRHWLEREMAWLDREAIPLWNTTSNHTTYDEMSEAVFREMLRHLPRNGPRGQEGLSYWVRRGDLLLVFVHTGWTGLGGEGHVETAWLRDVLHRHADARHKLVVGHHPVHPINGFSGAYQREIGPEHAAPFWDALVEGGVFAYLCSHILAFDVQVHRGVLQVCTAGAGTAHRMPEGIEYLHCAQAALDADGLRYPGARRRRPCARTTVLAIAPARRRRVARAAPRATAKRFWRAGPIPIGWWRCALPAARRRPATVLRKHCCRRFGRVCRRRYGSACAASSSG